MAVGACLVDTNVLLRMTRRSDPHHPPVDAALMTRPVIRNGLGLTSEDGECEVRAIEAGMSFLPDNEAVYREWRKIVTQYSVTGTQAHDARLVAVMYVHKMDHILTLNDSDFARYRGVTSIVPGNP